MNYQKKIVKYNKYYSIKRLFLFGLLFWGTFSSASISIPKHSSTVIRDNPKEVVDQVWQIIYRDFLDSNGTFNPNDWIRIRKDFLSFKYSNIEDSYVSIRNMLEKLNDPYTRFLDPREFAEMRIDTTGELMGVGIQISLEEQTGNIVVVSPIEDSPAFHAGIKPNDVINSINSKTTKGMNIENAVKLIRGKKGTEVILGIEREGRVMQFSLLRDKISINAVNSRLDITKEGYKIGYIRLKQFNANSPREMNNAINTLEAKKPLGYILDLRGNPGGLLEASVEIARQWIDKGIIVSTKSKDGINDIRRANGRSLTDRPVVLLINEGSASASEILSGAIQDNKRGFLVGKKTFGKGLVQSVRSLSDGSGLTVTIAKYLTPNGNDINKYGINPDFEVEQSLSKGKKITINDLGTLNDSQYTFAREILTKPSQDTSNYFYIPNTTNLEVALNKSFKIYQFSYIHTNQE